MSPRAQITALAARAKGDPRVVDARRRAALAAFAALAGPRPAARHVEPSLILSADDDVGPSERLLDVAAAAVAAARTTDLGPLTARLAAPPRWPDVWPGEHYRLLAGLAATLAPGLVVEIGTATGMSALALKAALPPTARLVTYDIVPWRDYPGSILREEDLADGRLEQRLHDLSVPEGWRAEAGTLREAGLVFVDAAKDGRQEREFLAAFEAIDWAAPPVVVFDDIRVANMLAIWRGVRRPKLDLTSFGHWSGTGLVDYA